MEAGFQFDDKDYLSVVQGENVVSALRLFNKDTKVPIDLDTASIALDLPAANSAPKITLRSSVVLTMGAGDADEDTITITDHGLAEDEPLVAAQVGTLPAGLSNGSTYYAKVIDKDTIKLAATAGGATIDLTTAGTGANTLTRASSAVVAAGTDQPNLGLLTVTMGQAVTAALKAGERQDAELEYTISSSKKIVELSKGLSVIEQAL